MKPKATTSSAPYLSLDLGDRYIGTAFSEAEILVSAGQMIDRQEKSDGQIFNQIAEMIKLKEIQTLIVGLPVNANGSENPRCQKIRDFIKKFEKFLDPNYYLLPTTYFFPEDFSSIDAKHQIKQNYKLNQKRPRDHSIAAKIILERFLELW